MSGLQRLREPTADVDALEVVQIPTGKHPSTFALFVILIGDRSRHAGGRVRAFGMNEGSIDGACSTLVRAVRRCFLTTPYRLR
jgi:hypothetical protein